MSSLIKNAIVKHSQGTAAAWTSAATVLEAGEIGYETDTGKMKIGDGSTAWASLAYLPLLSDLTSLTTYSTGWVSNSDWTDAEFTVTHSLTTNLSDLIVKFFISTDGAEANSIEVITIFRSSTAGGLVYGYQIQQSDTDNIVIQTGKDGVMYFNSTGDRVLLGSSSTFYYKVKVYKLS